MSHSSSEETIRFEMQRARKQGAVYKHLSSRGTRDLGESLVVVVLFWLLFSQFLGEQFVIPTGSMAPTLMGRHKIVQCDQCGHWYRVSASDEFNDNHRKPVWVVGTTCPLCRYPMTLNMDDNPDHRSRNGDRILVNKFTYWLDEPERWQAIVFKFPNDVHINYIKRLIGLPGETITIFQGDIYVETKTAPVHIARKPPDVVKSMLLLVDDTAHVSPLVAKYFSPRWRPSPGSEDNVELLLAPDERSRAFHLNGVAGVSGLRYRHIVPAYADWREMMQGRAPPLAGVRQGNLISDYGAYNTFDAIFMSVPPGDVPPFPPGFDSSAYVQPPPPRHLLGLHWVGDLAIECDVDVESAQGVLTLELIEAGDRYQCRLDLESGRAELAIDGEMVFDEGGEVAAALPSAQTDAQGPGRRHLRFANVDDKLTLWIDDEVVEFDRPTTYHLPTSSAGTLFDDLRRRQPVWSEKAPGDLEPARVSISGGQATIERLRVLRDIYYLAITQGAGNTDYDEYFSMDQVLSVLSDPQQWDGTSLFASRRRLTFRLGPDEYFPLGDNSPQSNDARLWAGDPHVDGELLTGRAILIVLPTIYRRGGVPIPSFERVGPIH